MTDVRYDDRSFLVDGQRVWLVSGAVHYFRIPSELWRGRLLKARRGGLNCISTCIAWNLHEPREGQWEMSGDKDIVSFIRQAGDMGLYVILRPGPYIAADWDFGGLPGWLTTKTGMAYRTNSAAYTHYFDKYCHNVLSRLAELQVTRGGNIVLIQNENQYGMTTMPDRLNHLEFISQLFRRSGFDIPIITNNLLTEPRLADSIECVSGGAEIVQKLKQLRFRQPDKPLIAIELHTGQADAWGAEHGTVGARQTARRAMEVLGCGAQYNYYMYEGGTHFGLWGSRMGSSDAAYQTTSYDYDAPIAEGGGLTEKYYLTRVVNMMAEHMGPFLAECTGWPPAATAHDSTAVMNLSSSAGSWVFVTNNGRDDITTVRICLPSGMDLTVPLGLIGAAAVPYEMTVAPEKVLDYSDLTPLGKFGEDLLVFHGPEGWPARISINGKEIRARVPKGDEPLLLEHQDLRIILVRSELAMRTWFVEDTLVFGPAFVGETPEDTVHAPGAKHVWLLPPDGKLTHRKAPADRPHRPTAPKLKPWKRISVCTEPVADDLEWTKIDRPTDVDKLGVHQGYLWQRLVWDEPRARKCDLFLPGCEDRATLFLNGSFLGIWGRSEDAARDLLPAELRRGANTLTLLLDNLGRSHSGWRLGEAKGLFGHVYEAKCLKRKPRLVSEAKFPRRIVPRGLSHLIDPLERLPAWSLEFELPLTRVAPVHLSFTDVPHHVAVLCNDRMVGFFPSEGRNFGDLTLAAELRKGKNLVQMMMWGDVDPKVHEKVRFHSLLAPLSQDAALSCRPWAMPSAGGPVVGKDQPAWYATEFTWQPHEEPLFVHVAGAKKGQVFLNGRNVGRFWTIGPQEYYYLPACWLAEKNELLLFVEQGHLPRRTRLEYRPLGPYRP
ncbi:MAG TPA: beta-galactosidase [Phycisphaerae bacterium]|nr:beta-galactosidase [Phycisphaerae bacterium]